MKISKFAIEMAKREAKLLARSFFVLGDPSQSVTDPKAVAALERAFLRLIETREHTVLQITEAEAKGFPCYQPHPENAGTDPRWYLAVGMDVFAKGVYVIQSFGLPDGMDERIRTTAAHSMILADLKLHTFYGGFPNGGQP
jgi:hypothetical protein